MAERWWSREAYAARRPMLLQRQRVMAAIRAFFMARGFVEVETPALQVSPGLEPHLQAFETDLVRPDGSRRRRYLHTSPEFACKKLLAAGEERLFKGAFGRIRDVNVAPDGSLWLLTDERRGEIIRIFRAGE